MYHAKMLLGAVPPFRLDLTVWALRRRQKNLLDRWDGQTYRRVVVCNHTPLLLAITRAGTKTEPRLGVVLQSNKEITPQTRKQVRVVIRRLLGLEIDLSPFYTLAKKNDTLKSLATQFRGVKPPRFPDVFEALVNAIACQQVTLDLGILLLNRLSEKFGLGFVEAGTTYYAFPRPVDLAQVAEQELIPLGFSRQKARAIKELAVRAANDEIELSSLEQMTNSQVLEFLLTLHGVGRWSAEYALLRGLGRLDVFPGDDVGAQNNLQHLYQLERRPGYQEIRELGSQWSPYEGLVYFHLLLEKLKRKGVV